MKITVCAPAMLPFPRLRLLPREDGESGNPGFELESNVVVRLVVRNRLIIVSVLAGYETDLASVPPWLQSLFRSNDPKTALAALVHDALYASRGGELADDKVAVHGGPLTRRESDAVLVALMRTAGCSRVRRSLYHIAVRIFGGTLWNSHK